MNEPILFPDAVATVIALLNERLPDVGVDDVNVCQRIPADRPATFVHVLRTGGVRANLVTDAAQITIEAWAPTSAAAQDLAQQCRAILLAAWGSTIAGVPIYRVDELSGPIDLPDTDSQQQRYTFTHIVLMRGRAAP